MSEAVADAVAEMAPDRVKIAVQPTAEAMIDAVFALTDAACRIEGGGSVA